METTMYLRVGPDELDDVLAKIEESFAITFGTDDLREVETFGQLCDAILAKIQLSEVGDCTSQQAFYKLRQSLVDVLHVTRQTIRPTTKLAVLFPKRTRRAAVRQLEEAMGFNLDMIMASPYLILPALLLLISSVVVLIKGDAPLYAVGGVLLAITLFVLAVKFARHLTVKTVGELAEKLAREQYTKVRRDSCTVNKHELVALIQELFCTDLGFSSDVLKPDSLLQS